MRGLSQALLKQSGPAVSCIQQLEQGRFSLAISPEILAELEEVVSRSRLREEFPLLTNERAEQLIGTLMLKGKLFRRVPKRIEFPRDPDDEPYLNLAIEAGAQFLVTRDLDLLDLMRWDTEEGRDFQSRFRQLRILDPVQFLKEIEAE